jgi:hypothetical protein
VKELERFSENSHFQRLHQLARPADHHDYFQDHRQDQ